VVVPGSDLGQHYFVDAVIEEFTLQEDSEVTLSFRTSDNQWLRADDVRLYSLAKSSKAVTPGDVNGDGIVSVEDVTTLAQYLMDGSVEIDTSAADANEDGVISVADITTIVEKILYFNNLNSFP
jgi:hypothetical protein